MKTNLLFFTKGRKTERIWYYDLSQMKVGKKTPMTLKHFAGFFELLSQRGTAASETDHSWTIDFAARRAQAQSEVAPFRREAEAQRERALNCREQAKIERKAAREVEADTLLAASLAADRDARDASAKAQAIEDAIYDLKAVNPRERKTGDVRTPMELLEAIETKGREVDAALARLRELTSA